MTDDLDPAAPPVAAGTIQIWSDLLCPFAYVGLIWLRRARARLGLDGRVRVEHRIFPLELFNGPHPRRGTDTEAVGLGQIEARLLAGAMGGRLPRRGLLRRRRLRRPAQARGPVSGAHRRPWVNRGW
ncbi:hypothetical protein ACFYUK_38910 [Nonomuraea wenchangensis]